MTADRRKALSKNSVGIQKTCDTYENRTVNHLQEVGGSSWEPNSDSANQEVTRLLWNSNIHYRVHKKPLLVPVESQINPVQTSSYLFKINFNIILPYTPRSPKYSLTFRLSE
jgi:hypothetical protein